jgi:hypothetical protein
MLMGLSITIETLKTGFSVVLLRKIAQELHSSRIFRYDILLVLAKVKVKVKFTLEQTTKVQRGCRGIALLFI